MPESGGYLLYLLFVPWAYVFMYGVNPFIEEWVSVRYGVTFITVRRGYVKSRYFTVIKEDIGFLRKCYITYFVYGPIGLPLFAVWMGLGVVLLELVKNYILKA